MDQDYFRRDQRNGISPPDLTKDSTYAEHIVHARGNELGIQAFRLICRGSRILAKLIIDSNDLASWLTHTP